MAALARQPARSRTSVRSLRRFWVRLASRTGRFASVALRARYCDFCNIRGEFVVGIMGCVIHGANNVGLGNTLDRLTTRRNHGNRHRRHPLPGGELEPRLSRACREPDRRLARGEHRVRRGFQSDHFEASRTPERQDKARPAGMAPATSSGIPECRGSRRFLVILQGRPDRRSFLSAPFPGAAKRPEKVCSSRSPGAWPSAIRVDLIWQSG